MNPLVDIATDTLDKGRSKKNGNNSIRQIFCRGRPSQSENFFVSCIFIEEVLKAVKIFEKPPNF